MLKLEVEKPLAKYLSIGTFFVSIFLLVNTNTDPVNVTKLFALGGVSVSVFSIAIFFGGRNLFDSFRAIIILLVLFNLFQFFALVSSQSPWSQNYFGTYGRNNGLLAYLLLSGILISALQLRRTSSFEMVFYGLFTAGAVNILYCAWVLAFGDFIPWSNPYGSILGLLGNPDFLSAFLGMFIAGSVAFAVSTETNRYLRLILSATSILGLFEIIKSHAIQGLVVTAGGLAITGFFVLKSKFESRLVPSLYVLAVFVAGVFAVLGTLQKGPLSFVYKRSVSLRGSYWRAGLEMGKSHPLTGVGLDSYGDWYRRARPPVALIDTPGINTVSNVAHNVVIDFFASGGFPLVISYLAILLLGIISILRVNKRIQKYNRVFVGITAIWLCYEVQSLISINQIGLAIWGWVFTGILFAFEYSTRPEAELDNARNIKNNSQYKSQQNIVSPQLVGGVGLILGLLIALPPLSADAKWFNATRSRDATKVESALTPSAFNPPSSARYAQAVNLFQNSNLPALAHKYALTAVKFNPDYFDAWKQLFLLPSSTNVEKSNALLNLKRLDPRNPDVTANK